MNTADLGDVLKVLEIVTIIGTGTGLAFKVGSASAKFEALGERHTEEITQMKNALGKLVDAQEQQIKNTERLDSTIKLIAEMRTEINDLRRGRGFIQGAVDGEYPRR